MRKSLHRNTGLFLLLLVSVIDLTYSQNNQSFDQERSPSDQVGNEKTNFLSDILNSSKKNNADSLRTLPKIKLGGALRLNYSYRNYDQENMDRLR